MLAADTLTGVTWMTRPILVEHVGPLAGLSDAGIAMTAALALFLLPSGEPDGRRLLDWKLARELLGFVLRHPIRAARVPW